MANVIDENKIVLYFDHSDFKKNTQDSINILNSLKDKLTGSATVNSVERLGDAAQKLNLSGMADSIETVGKRMKFMGIVGATVINRLTNQAITSGISVAKALPQQIIQGGWNRAQNIEKAKFLIEGLGFAWDETSEKYVKGSKTIKQAVDEAVTGTAYSLDEAALIASQFMSSGIENADELQKALESVSGLASVLSADYGDIGRIFAQVAGQGRMMGDDLLQLSQRGIGAASEIAKYLNKNEKVKTQAIETAIAQGHQVKKMEEIGKQSKITEADVREMVSAGAISFDILQGAMHKFFKQATKANDTYKGSLSNLKSAFNRLGETFEAVKLKNLTRIFNALIPVVKRLKEILEPFTDAIGNMSTKVTDVAVKAIRALAKEMGVDFTKRENKGFFRFAKGLSRFKKDIDKTNEEINKGNKKNAQSLKVTAREWQAALDIWYKGSYGTGQKRADEIRKLGMSYERVQGIINKFYKNDFDWEKTKDQVFKKGKNTKDQKENNKAIEEGAKAAKSQNQELSALGKTAKGIVNIVRTFSNTIQFAVTAAKTFKTITSELGGALADTFATGFLSITSHFRRFSKGLRTTMTTISEFGDGWRDLLSNGNALATFFETVWIMANKVSRAFKIVSGFIGGFLKSISSAIKSISKGNKPMTVLEKVIQTILNYKSSLMIFIQGVTGLLSMLTSAIFDFLESLDGSAVGKFFSTIGDKIAQWFLTFSEYILDAAKFFNDFVGVLINGESVIEFLTGKSSKLGKVFDKFKNVGTELKKGFESLGKVVSGKVLTYFDKIEAAFKTITGAVKKNNGVGLLAGSLLKVGEAFANFITGLATGEDTAGSFFAKIGVFAHDFMSVVSQAFEWVLDHIGPAVEKIIDFFKQLSKSEGFDKLKTSLKDAVDSMTQMAHSGFGQVVEWFKEIAAVTFNNDNMTRLIDFFSGLAGGVGDFIDKINKGESPIKSFFDTWSKTKEVMSFKYQAQKSLGEQFSDVVNAPALASSLNQVKKLDIGNKTLDAANTLTKFTTTLSEGLSEGNLEALTGETFENLKEANWDKVSKIALRIASIGAIIKSTYDLGKLVASVGGIAKSISGFFNSLSGISMQIQKTLRVEAFRTMAIAIAMIAASITVLALIPKEKMLPAAGVIMAFMLAMLSVLKITTRKEFNPRSMLDVGIAFAGMGAGMLMMAGAVAALGKLKPEQLGKGVLAVLSFMAAMLAISKLGSNIFGVGQTFLAMALGVTVLIGAIKVFAKMDPMMVAKGVATITGVMFSLALAARIAGRGAKGNASFFAIAAALYALIPAIVLMALIPFTKAMQGAATISGVMIALGTAARIAQTEGGFKAMSAMATTIGVLTASLVILSFINPDRLMNAVIAILGVVTTIALSSAIMKEAKLAALMMAGVIAAITGAIVLLLEIDAQGAANIAGMMALLATSLGIACAAITIAGAAAPAAIAGIGIMLILISLFGFLIAGLAALGEDQGVMAKVDAAGEFLNRLGQSLGKFASGFVTGATSDLGNSADELKKFVDVFVPLLHELSAVNLDGIGALKDLAQAILAITGGGILDKIGSKIGGKKTNKGSFESFGETLDVMAENFIPFVKKIGSGEGINTSALEKVKSFGDAVKVFSDIAGALPKESNIKFGPLKATFGKVEDLDDFADNVKKAAKSIGKAATNAEGFDASKVGLIGRVGEALGAISDVAKKLPQVGVLPTLKGKTDLGKFAEDLGDFVPHFLKFSQACDKSAEGDTFGNLSRVQNVADSVAALATAAKSIPNVSGIHPIKGKKEIADFASDLADFVPSFKTFSDACGAAANADTFGRLDRVKNVAASVAAMAEAAQLIPDNISGSKTGASIGAAISGKGGNGGLAKFAQDLGDFVQPFYDFSNEVSKHTKVFGEENLNRVSMIGTALSALADVKAKIAGVVDQTGSGLFDWGGGEKGETLESFGTSLTTLAGNLEAFIQGTKNLKTKEINAAGNKMEAVTGVIKKFTDLGVYTDGEFALPDGSELVDFADNMKEFGSRMTGVTVDEEKFDQVSDYLTTFKDKLAGLDIKDVNAKSKMVSKVSEALTNLKALGAIPKGENLSALATNINTFVTTLRNDVDVKGIADKASKVKTAIKKLASAAKVAASETGDGASGMIKAGASIGSDYVQGIKNKYDAAKKAGETLAKKAISGAGKDSYVGDMKDIGKALGDGVAKGLADAYDAVCREAEKIIAKANEAARAKADMNSPSKLFAKIGRGLGEGLVLGMKQYERNVYNASYDMSAQSIEAANLALQGLDEVASPTITPVIDLSNVRKGARDINAMVSSSKAIDVNARVSSSPARYATPGMVSKLFDKVNDMTSKGVSVRGGTGAQITNNITVDGAENPEDFANRFVRQLQMEMRTV